MPWEAIIGSATGGVALAIVAGALFVKLLAEKVASAAEQRFKSTHESMLALASAVDTDLRSRRIEVYRELWTKTGLVPQYPRNLELTYRDLRGLSAELRKWYFEVGGMFLSGEARKAYGAVQESLTALATKGEGNVDDAAYESIRSKCSALRTELTTDLASRREAPKIDSR